MKTNEQLQALLSLYDWQEYEVQGNGQGVELTLRSRSSPTPRGLRCECGRTWASARSRGTHLRACPGVTS